MITKEMIMCWSAKEQLLSQENPNRENSDGVSYDRNYIYSIEKKSTITDKIEMISKFDNDFLNLLSVIDLFRQEESTIKRDNYGYKTTSLKAWIKRNNASKYINDFYHYGKIYGYNNGSSSFYIQYMVDDEKKDEFINVVFHQTLALLRVKELDYYFDNDEYTVLKRKWKAEHISDFDVPLGYWSSGRITIRDIENDLERDITIDELKQLLDINNKAKAYIQKLSDECNIKF